MSTQSKTILLVDDEPDICEALGLALRLQGFDVKTVQDRQSALCLADEAAPAVILLDYRMPGLDAADFVVQMRQRNAAVPIVLLTAGGDAGAIARDLGLRYFLPKPFELNQIVDLIRRALAGS